MKRLSLFALLFALLFAACSSQPEPEMPDARPANLTPVTLALDFGLNTLAVPFGEDGAAVVERLEITILSADGTPLTFDESYNLDPEGSVAFIPYIPGDSVTVGIVAGQEYTFQARGFDGGDVWMSYGEVTQTVNVDTDTVALELHTLMEGVALDHTAPISSVVPGQLLDLYLSVTSPGGYEVPFEDYSAIYEVGADDGTVNEQSDLGTRVIATSNPLDNDFTVSVTVIGWMIVDGVAVEGEQMLGEFTVPFVENAGFFLDNERPSLSVNDPGTVPAGEGASLTGSALDNVGLLKVQVFEGPALIGSSDTNEYAEEGVAEVSFAGNDWTLNWTPEAGDYDLTVVAFDSSGNQAEVQQSLSVVPTLSIGYDINLYFDHPRVIGGPATPGLDGAITKIELFAKQFAADDSTFQLVGSTEGGTPYPLTYSAADDRWQTDEPGYDGIDGNCVWEALKVVVTDELGNTAESGAEYRGDWYCN